MKGLKTLVNASVVGIATLGLGLVSSAASAQSYPQLVNQGPNGAAHIVDNAPRKSARSSQQFQYLVSRGPNGAAFIVSQKGIGGGELNLSNPNNRFPKLVNRGSNGAAHIVN